MTTIGWIFIALSVVLNVITLASNKRRERKARERREMIWAAARSAHLEKKANGWNALISMN